MDRTDKNPRIIKSKSNTSLNSNIDDSLIAKALFTIYDDDEDEEEYVMKTKVCKRLSKEFGLPEIQCDETQNYEPPKEPGLTNCDAIIPAYYQLDKHPSKIFDIDYYEIIKDDIRNYRTLNRYQMEYIKQLSHEHKNELFDIFNLCINTFNAIL